MERRTFIAATAAATVAPLANAIEAPKVEQSTKPSFESFALANPWRAFDFAIHFVKPRHRIPELEAVIAQDAQCAFDYASFKETRIDDGYPEMMGFYNGERFLAGEEVISKSPKYAFKYAQQVVDGRWEEGEAAIATEAELSCWYAQHVLEAPFPLGEKIIAQDPEYALEYAQHVIKGRWKPGEAAIATDKFFSYEYARDVLKGRFPLGEKAIGEFDKGNAQRWDDYAFYYAHDVVKGPFPEGEEAIAQGTWTAVAYAKDILKAPFPMAEPLIAKHSSRAWEYVEHFWAKGEASETIAEIHHEFLVKHGQGTKRESYTYYKDYQGRSYSVKG